MNLLTAPAGSESSTLSGWLRCLASWLGTPLRCHGLRLVWVPQPVEQARWADSLDAVDASTLDAGEGDAEGAADGGGWLLPLESGSSGVLCLFCASHADATSRAAVDGAVLAQAATAAAAGWSLAKPHASDEVEVVLVERQRVRRAIHDFRNGLNALLMNAATLSYRADTLPEPLRRFASQLELEGERCTAALDELEQLIAHPDAPTLLGGADAARGDDSAKRPS